MTSRREFLAMAGAATVQSTGRRGVHHIYDFQGTPYEIGMQHGKALRNEIVAEAAPALARLAGAAPRIVARYEGLFREHMPNVLEEIRGIADGAQLSYPEAFFAATRDMMHSACTAVAVSGKQSADGRPLLGQTKDTEAPLYRFRIQRIRYSSGRRAIVLNYPGWIANLCLTSDGMSFTGNSLYGAAPAAPTAPGSFLKRLIMEKRSTSEVLDSIRGLTFENGCILIGDRSGHMVCLEMLGGRTVTRELPDQAFGHANDVLSPELKRFQKKESASSPLRQASIDRILRENAGGVSVEVLKRAFCDHHDYPLSICRHPSPRDRSTTNASFISDLRALEMHIAIGNPCTAPFERYAVPV